MPSDPSNATISQAEYARLRKVSRQAVNDLVVRGVLQLHDGKIDIAEADAACLEHLDPSRSNVVSAIPGPAGSPETPDQGGQDLASTTDTDLPVSYHAARTMREKYEALDAKAAHLLRVGGLVLAADVEREQFSLLRRVRDAWLSQADRLAPRLAAMTGDPTRIHHLMTEDSNGALRELSATLAAEAAGGPGQRADAVP